MRLLASDKRPSFDLIRPLQERRAYGQAERRGGLENVVSRSMG